MTKVLVADDDTDNRALMSAVLTSLGIEVVSASSGDAALLAAREGGLDAILLDVRMPGMTGPEVCAALRAGGHHDVPVLLISACASPEEIERGLDSGADDYLVKPFRVSDFASRVTTLLAAARPGVSPALSAALATRGALRRSSWAVQPLSSAIG
jgi:CheY-like chemotaxis protein